MGALRIGPVRPGPGRQQGFPTGGDIKFALVLHLTNPRMPGNVANFTVENAPAQGRARGVPPH